MKKYLNIRRDNSGSTLILVVICVAYIAILCSALLSMTLGNREMKSVERRARDNFYTAETALAEIRAGLETLAADALEAAYIEVMEHFIGLSGEERQVLLEQTYLAELENLLCTSAGSSFYRRDLLRSMVTISPAAFVTAEGENILERDKTDPARPQYLMLKNVKVSYLDAWQFQTTLTTDILLHTPAGGGLSLMEGSGAFCSYGLIADRGISLHTAPGVKVEGNVYAGEEGIRLDNLSDLQISHGKQVITRGDISVKDRSVLVIDGNPDIWARNILTRKGSATEEKTKIQIEGNCYVGDDLTLDAEGSSVTIKGKYYGFSHGASRNPGSIKGLFADDSSAILINGRNSYLDLSGLETLMLSGRAFVEPALDGSSEADIYMGEALTVKENQAAYLVPAAYLWCGVNPVPGEAYAAYQKGQSGEPEVDFNKVLEQPFPISLEDYADGFINLFYHYPGGQSYVYYYLKFKSEVHANAYMQEYYRIFQEGAADGLTDLNRSLERNTTGILLNPAPGSVISRGNLFTYEPSALSNLLPGTMDIGEEGDGGGQGASASLQQAAGRLARQYDSLCRSLEPVSLRTPYDEASLFHSLIRTEDLIAEVSTVEAITLGEYVIYLVNNAVGTEAEFDFALPVDHSLPNKGRKGMVIATGNVIVDGSYQGLILAGKEIRLMSGAAVTASDSIVNAVLGAGDPRVNGLFRTMEKAAQTGASMNHIVISDLVSYQNWRRNED